MGDMTGGAWQEPGGFGGAWDAASLGDVTDAQKMEPFNPTGGAVPWWQSLIQYGAVRAIDNRYGPTNVAGNVNPGSFAGQNGRSYQQGGTPQPATGGALAGALGGGTGGLLLLAAVGALIFLAVK